MKKFLRGLTGVVAVFLILLLITGWLFLRALLFWAWWLELKSFYTTFGMFKILIKKQLERDRKTNI